MVLLFSMCDLCYANQFTIPSASAYTWAVLAYFSVISIAVELEEIQ